MEEKKTRKKRGQRADGRIQVTYTDGYRPDGKPNRISFYGATRSEAERKRREYIDRGKNLITGDELTVSEWINQYKKTYRNKINPAYLNNDDVPYNRLAKSIGNLPLSAVREIDLQNALNDVGGMSYSTINKYQQTMKKLFLRAQKNKLITTNPASDLVLPSYKKGTHRSLERWEVECIIKNWDQHRAGIWAMLMLLAGLRRGEAMALRWENVNMEKRQLLVTEVIVIESNASHVEERAKTNAGIRIIPICEPLWNALNKTPVSDRKGLICVSASGKMNTESSFSRGWDGFNLAMERILNNEPVVQAGKRKRRDPEDENRIHFNVRSHDLRHTFATALFEAGVPVKAAQYYLGHADIRVTLDLYTHLSKEKEQQTRSQLVGFLDGWLNDNVMNDSIRGSDESLTTF